MHTIKIDDKEDQNSKRFHCIIDGEYVEMSEKQAKSLWEVLDINKTKSKRWQPKDKEEYWYVGDDGWVESDYWYGNGNTDDPFRLGQNNVHKSKKLAEQHLELLKAQAEIRNSSDFEPDWSDKEQDKYVINYDYGYHTLDIAINYCWIPYSLAYYPTQEAAKQAIKDHREAYELVFGVKKMIEAFAIISIIAMLFLLATRPNKNPYYYRKPSTLEHSFKPETWCKELAPLDPKFVKPAKKKKVKK